jgi:hypothetical protein
MAFPLQYASEHDRSECPGVNVATVSANACFARLCESSLSSVLLHYLQDVDVLALVHVSKQTHALGTDGLARAAGA